MPFALHVLDVSTRSFLTCSFGKEPIDMVWKGEVKTFRQSLNQWSQLATAQGITLAQGLTLDRSLASHNTPGCSTKLMPKPSQEKRQALTLYRTLTDKISILECSLRTRKTILLLWLFKKVSVWGCKSKSKKWHTQFLWHPGTFFFSPQNVYK